MPPCTKEPPSPALQQLVEAMNGGAGLFGPGIPLDRVSPGMVIDVASLILQGFHAVPVKLKMLLDRLFSLLNPEEITAVLRGFGWTIQDYQRGYILKDPHGGNLEKWRMCSPEDEPLILQQFLRFTVTRPLTQQLILQELCEKNADSKAKLQDQMMKMMNNNKPGDSVKTTLIGAPLPASSATLSPVRSHTSPSSPRTSPEGGCYLQPPPPSLTPSSSALPPHSHSNGSGLPPPSSPSVSSSSSLPSPSPLNKLQSMHPFDYRKAATASDRRTPEVPRSPVEKPLPPSISPMRAFHQPGLPPGYPIPPSFGLHPGMAPYQHQMAKFHEQERKSKEEHLFNPMNLSRGHEPKHDRTVEESGGQMMGRRPGRIDPTRQYAAFHEDLGTTFVNPATGKKRVQCNVCLKTFCDKGALKIHFSAVHLREMHKCSVPGCNMMFSSRRSRNRHSANPNPKLHTPQVKRRISQNDGRTHPGPNLGSMAPSPITPILPKEPTKESPREQPAGFPQLPPGFPHPGMPGFPPGFPGLNLPGFNPFMPPDLKALQQDLQRFSDLSKLFPQPPNGEQRSDSESGVDGGNRKRKSQNPTKRPHLDMDESEHISSDSASDEGFPDPMMEDDDDDLGDVSSGDDAA